MMTLTVDLALYQFIVVLDCCQFAVVGPDVFTLSSVLATGLNKRTHYLSLTNRSAFNIHRLVPLYRIVVLKVTISSRDLVRG